MAWLNVDDADLNRTAARVVRKARDNGWRVVVRSGQPGHAVAIGVCGNRAWWASWIDGKFSCAWGDGCRPMGARELELWVSTNAP